MTYDHALTDQNSSWIRKVTCLSAISQTLPMFGILSSFSQHFLSEKKTTKPLIIHLKIPALYLLRMRYKCACACATSSLVSFHVRECLSFFPKLFIERKIFFQASRSIGKKRYKWQVTKSVYVAMTTFLPGKKKKNKNKSSVRGYGRAYFM